MSTWVILCRNSLLRHILCFSLYVHFIRDLTLNLKDASLTLQVNEEWFCVDASYFFSSSERDWGNEERVGGGGRKLDGKGEVDVDFLKR